jgi:hypothetical protein
MISPKKNIVKSGKQAALKGMIKGATKPTDKVKKTPAERKAALKSLGKKALGPLVGFAAYKGALKIINKK